MTIVFPTTEPKGLQAQRALYYENAVSYTFIEINDKGGITAVKNLDSKQLASIHPDNIVTKFPLQTEYDHSTQVFIDPISPNVDRALIKVLQEELFCKSSA